MTADRLRSLTSRHGDAIGQFAGYVCVSGCALCVDLTAYWLMLGIARYAFVAAACGYVCGVLTHYALSSRLVFSSRLDKRGVLVEAPTIAKFFAAGLFGLVVTASIVGLLADVMGVHPLIAKLSASGCSFIVVFLSLRYVVFRMPAHSVANPA